VKARLALILSATALAVAVFGSTPLGHAVVSVVPPLATHAKTADYAANAGAVNGLKASKRPRVGWLVALGPGGKFPAGVGQVGPSGPPGVKGDKGDQGLQGLTGAKGPIGVTGPTGPTGRQGLQGTAGPPGPSGVTGWQFVTAGQTIAPGQLRTWRATCPAGKRALGGGVVGSSGLPDINTQITQDGPDGQATGWLVSIYNNGGANLTLSYYAWVICASV